MYLIFTDPTTSSIYTLSLHDALPISEGGVPAGANGVFGQLGVRWPGHCCQGDNDVKFTHQYFSIRRSEEHTSELQSRLHLVCRLLLEKKKRASLPFIYLRFD